MESKSDECLGSNCETTLPKEMDEDVEKLEREHFQRIVNAFRCYRAHSLKRIAISERNYHELSDMHKKLIPNFQEQMNNLRHCVDHNYEIVKQIIHNTDQMFENSDHGPINGFHGLQMASEFDMDKVRTTIKQFVRDWSEEGATERELCYKPVVEDVLENFPPEKCNTAAVKVLVPGAGLGRLAYEIARRGYYCQGNEWSLFMLFASNYVLNRCHSVNSLTFYPWIHQWCNNRRHDDQIKAMRFPDADPSAIPPDANFSMAAGDFLEVYTEPDTAHNIIEYIETIMRILKPGGIWINLGPLLYHFADMPKEKSLELSYEDVRSIILKTGFIFKKENLHVKSGYTQNINSMLSYEYDSVFFVVEKTLS
ncbi:carnosine N-methyltransferase-like isoform X2 [Tubulanus polymorphus]|uniref:carnosine N-methyltransferase-like isoform X2 n=1 Tax=Tubulanus polymorphus TaxID=672921 RepID=UPI003DA6BA69